MEKINAFVYLKYKISYMSLINKDCMPIYDGKQVLDNHGSTFGLKPIGHIHNPLSSSRKVYLPREFETKEEAYRVCGELNSNGLFEYQVETIIDHIVIP